MNVPWKITYSSPIQSSEVLLYTSQMPQHPLKKLDFIFLLWNVNLYIITIL